MVLPVGPHDQVKGKNTQPGRVIWNLQTDDVKGDFDRFRQAGATVVQEPYRPEGPDDMPAHIKAALSAVSLSIPVTDSRPALGTWQGIYLFEHRNDAHTRRVVAHVSR